MKKYYVFLAALIVSFSLHAQIIDIPDDNFKNALVNTNCVDTDGDGFFDSDADLNDDGEIQVSEAELITLLNVEFESISSLEGIEYFINLFYLNFGNNQITQLNLNNLINLEELLCYNNQITSLNLNTLTRLTKLDCHNNQIPEIDVSTLTNLTDLDCGGNQLTALHVSTLTNLTRLSCDNNQITSLDVSALTNIYLLNCGYNLLTALDVSTLAEMEILACSNNQLTSLDVSAVTNLRRLWFDFNDLSNIDLTNNVVINWLYCNNNQLANLDISTLNTIQRLFCNNNQLTELDISNNRILNHLDCSENELVSMNLKNGFLTTQYIDGPYEFILDFNNNPYLSHICVDDGRFTYDEISEFNGVQNLVNSYGYTNCVVNSYCSFIPGGTFYTVEGNTRIDLDSDGCDNSDSVFQNLNFAISDGNETGNFISNSSGNYSIPVQDGYHTITPTLENPDYFSVSPTSITVDFPADTSPHVQDFCVTANGSFNDLEIAVLPLEAARPGFDTAYKLIYKNKGTTVLSGSVDLMFQDDIMDFVSASPTQDSQAGGMLSWNFTDLTPFETREITFTMGLNAPTDTPPINGDDVLVYEALINHSETEETPDDNTSVFNQTVVNSYDPNDKTCLEGDFITPEMVGEYVHYMIRFENTGSANAINIVVKDDIDVTKYDLSTLVPLHASHDYVARIKDQGTDHYVEFIFEGIDLPFDDANNDGYVAFKIKTLDTLELNDSFENNAAIYFDYNFPIITNDATTTIATLSTDDFELANTSISLFPNPTTNVLHLEAKQAIKHVYMYDVSGRLIKDIAVIGSKNNLDISTQDLTSGTYFVKIKTVQGEAVKKVIKK